MVNRVNQISSSVVDTKVEIDNFRKDVRVRKKQRDLSSPLISLEEAKKTHKNTSRDF